MKNRNSIYILFAAVVGWLLYSCASIGNPEGGPQDKEAPIFLKSSPQPYALNVSKKKIELSFDEIVTLKDPSTKIVISPAQTEMPKMSTSGKKVTIELIDSLLDNTTYTIDFSNSIQDNNEGNPLENFAFAFSTGSTIDSLRVSGIVLNSRTLEPQQNVIVGLQSNLSDSAFNKIKLERIARTNSLGQFVVRNVKPGKYNIFAINDVDRDYKFANRSEDIAFYDSIVVPTCNRAEVSDTIYKLDNKTVDSVRTTIRTKYFPNDILLCMFNENYKSQYLQNNSRIDSTRLSILFAAPSDTLPTLKIINRPQKDNSWYLLERNETNDSLLYWITKPELVSSDSLRIALRYLKTDSTDNLAWQEDTLNFNFQRPKIKKKKRKKEEMEDSIQEIPFLNISVLGGGTQEVYAPLYLQTPEPIANIDTAAIHLAIKQDTLWNEVKNFTIAFRDTTKDKRTFRLKTKWEAGATYKLTCDSICMTNIYGVFNRKYETSFNVRKYEDYGNLIFNIVGLPDEPAVAELLDGSDKVVLAVPVKNGKAEFINMLPSKYYARLYIDKNGNGKYDTGNYAQKLQPEDTYYYPRFVNLKKNWDIEQTWDINSTAIDMQKPEDIKKNKPERKKWDNEDRKKKKNSNSLDEDGDGFDEYGNPVYDDDSGRRLDPINGMYR